jgi:hypothetical protein
MPKSNPKSPPEWRLASQETPPGFREEQWIGLVTPPRVFKMFVDDSTASNLDLIQTSRRQSLGMGLAIIECTIF